MQLPSPTIPHDRRQERGVALVITLGILSILVILAVAFMLNSRNEIVSAAYYRDMVTARSVAKMGFDRALMELSYLNALSPDTGTNSGVYALTDLGQLDNFVFSTNCTPSAAPGDFVNRDTNPCRADSEPYWIYVKDQTGKVVGRFAYITYGGLVDINAIGNIAGAGDIYQRSGGFLGVSNTWGNASDVSLEHFLERLGYADPVESARRIVTYRYGWDSSGIPAVGFHKPGMDGVDDDNDGSVDNPAEYNGLTTIDNDQRINDLAQLDVGNPPWPNANPIAPDPASVYLRQFATTDSGESNLTNQFGVARFNINTNATPLGVMDAFLYTNMVPTIANLIRPTLANSNLAFQIAVNMIDFRTPTRYPTVFTTNLTPVRTFIGVKETPYLNQILRSNIIIQTKVISSPATGSNYTYGVRVLTFLGVELWNPYNNFPDPCTVITTNFQGYNLGGGGLATFNQIVPWIATNQFTPPLSGYSANYTNNLNFVFTNYGNQITTNNWAPPMLIVTQRMMGAQLYGNNNRTNLINLITGAQTNVLSVALDWSVIPTNQYPRTNIVFYSNWEADDPRMNALYLQPNGAPDFTLGSANVNTYQPNTTIPSGPYPGNNNPFTLAAGAIGIDSGPREGIASFYVRKSNYVSIGDIGYVHRGEPWATIRLQKSPGVNENRLLDLIRVTNLETIRGRISLNSDINFPPGVATDNYLGPAFYALFGGLTNSAYGNVTSNKISNIVQGLENYRSTVLAGQGFDALWHLAEIPALNTDLANTPIPFENDAAREQIIRDVANLVTVSKGGAAEIIAWGQTMRGNTPGALVVIRGKFDRNVGSGSSIKLTKFQYITP